MRERKQLFIGYYNASVILTYISLGFSVCGIFFAFKNLFKITFLCLIASGVCDMFDGKIASMVKRDSSEKLFGIQIDSLCDLVCFGVFPAIILRALGNRQWFWSIVAFLYVLAAVIRLGYFNVSEIQRQSVETGKRKYYQGLPVTSVALIFPFVYAIEKPVEMILGMYDLGLVFGLTMILCSILFISNFKFRKPGGKGIMIMSIIGIFVIIGVLFGK